MGSYVHACVTSFASVPPRTTDEDPRWRTVGSFAAHFSAAAYSRMPNPLDRDVVQCSTAGKVWSRFVDTRGRSSRTTVGASLLHCMHRTMRGKPYISSVDPRWRAVGLSFFATRSSAAAYSHTPTPLDRGLIQRPKAGKVWFRFVNARGRSSRTTILHFSL